MICPYCERTYRVHNDVPADYGPTIPCPVCPKLSEDPDITAMVSSVRHFLAHAPSGRFTDPQIRAAHARCHLYLAGLGEVTQSIVAMRKALLRTAAKGKP